MRSGRVQLRGRYMWHMGAEMLSVVVVVCIALGGTKNPGKMAPNGGVKSNFRPADLRGPVTCPRDRISSSDDRRNAINMIKHQHH